MSNPKIEGWNKRKAYYGWARGNKLSLTFGERPVPALTGRREGAKIRRLANERVVRVYLVVEEL